MKQPETKFKEQVKSDLDSLKNCWHEKIQQRSIRGTPDILVCLCGLFIALELKKDSPLEKLQKRKIHYITEAGGLGVVVTPVNWPCVFAMLQRIDAQGRKHADYVKE